MDWQKYIDQLIQMLLVLLVSIGLIHGSAPRPAQPYQATLASAAGTATETPVGSPTRNPGMPASETGAPTPTSKPTAAPTLDPQSLRPEPGSICGYDPQVEALLRDLEQDDWAHWIELLSGEAPVELADDTFTILTRDSESMFNGNPKARAYAFVLDQLRQWGYQDDLDLFEHEYHPIGFESTTTWRNIIAIIPGRDPGAAHEQVLLTAHLDSISVGDPEARAPGADDNGSGAATLLEAARILKRLDLRRTIKIIFFTGEEQGLHGSKAYVHSFVHDTDSIVGVINLDMFGYDADNDRCFEIHVGWLPESHLVGGCLADTIEAYDFNLKFEYIVKDAIRASDHASFWNEGIGAIEVLENFRGNDLPNVCGESDRNPHYHTEDDLIQSMNLDTGHAIAKAAIAAVLRLAEPLGSSAP